MVTGGVVFLLLALAGGFAGKIEIPDKRQKWAGAIGSLLLILGTVIYIVPASADVPPSPPPSTSLPGSTSASAGTFTPISQVSTPDPTMTATPTITSVPTSIDIPTETPSVTPEQNVLVQDDFNRNIYDWDVDESFESEWIKAGSRKIVDGKYYMEATAPESQGVFWQAIPDKTDPVFDFYTSIEAQRIQGSDNVFYGLFFRYQSGDNFYYFMINDKNQQFKVSLRSGGEWQTRPIPDTHSSAIKPVETNRLEVEAKEGEDGFNFYINGQQVALLNDDQLKFGRVGVGIELDAGESAIIEFDNLKIGTPPE